MVLNLDVAPTLLEIAGVPVPADMQGKSMLPLAEGKPDAGWRKDWLYEYYEYPGFENVRPLPRSADGAVQIYPLFHRAARVRALRSSRPIRMRGTTSTASPDTRNHSAPEGAAGRAADGNPRHLRIQAKRHPFALGPWNAVRIRLGEALEVIIIFSVVSAC